MKIPGYRLVAAIISALAIESRARDCTIAVKDSQGDEVGELVAELRNLLLHYTHVLKISYKRTVMSRPHDLSNQFPVPVPGSEPSIRTHPAS